MFKKSKGFTLIEILIVVAIIGILAALLIPNAITAIQKAKQKNCMKDIVTMSTGLADFITDHASFTVQNSGPVTQNFIAMIAPFYVKSVPSRDPWGNPYQAWDGLSGLPRGIAATDYGNDDFLIESWGRNSLAEGWTYDRTNPLAGMYELNAMPDFENDLINWSGSWIRAPRAAAGASGS